MDQTIRQRFVAVLGKLEVTEGVDAAPDAAVDAIPVEADSVTWNSPFREENSNEATGSLVAGAPLVVGQPATVRFRSRLKGANAGYTVLIKPPLHQMLSMAGKRGVFTAAVAALALAAGSATTATVAAPFAATAQKYRGMPLMLSVGAGAGAIPFITDYTAGRVATLTDSFAPALDATTLAAIPANWTYAGTSPADAAARATDHPSGTIYVYIDGVLRKFVGCRGRVDYEANAAGAVFASFELTGIYAGKSDTAMPATLAVANHSGPLLLKSTGISNAFNINRLPLPISQFSFTDNGELESPDDPNTQNGFGAGQIGGRSPVLSCDPLATLVATRDVEAQITAGQVYPGVIRAGLVANNRLAIVFPQLQPVSAEPGTRGMFRSEQTGFRALSPGKDSDLRDGDAILCFY